MSKEVSDTNTQKKNVKKEEVSWSLTSHFSINMAISEIKGQGW